MHITQSDIASSDKTPAQGASAIFKNMFLGVY